MGKLTVTTFVTLDGVMQAPGGPDEDRSGAFSHGGWAFPFDGPQFGEFMVDVFGRVDAFLLGRRTYEIFASYWPKQTDPNNPIASKLNQLPKHVASSRLEKPTWNNTSVVRDVAGEVAALKQRYARELQVHGSGDLVQTLLRHELIDELNVLIYPVLLGTGQRLFESRTVPTTLKLLGATPTDNGVILTRYARAGKPTYGSYA